MRPHEYALFSLLLMIPTHLAADSTMNRTAQVLAKQIAPTPAALKADPGDLEKLRQRMIAILETLAASSRSSGPGPESLLAKAYDFRDDVAGIERLLTTNAILDAWHEAEGRGLFNEFGRYSGDITKGRGVGQRCLFELIVPAETYPPASNQLANLRLVPEGTQRVTGSAPSPREETFRGEMAGLIAEKERSAELHRFENPPATNALGFTEKESLERWSKAMAAAGDKAGAQPRIRLAGRVTGTPSHMTGQRWRVAVEVINFSTHPTEISVEIHLLGHTWKKHAYYLMARSTEKLKLLANETRSVELFSKAEGGYKNPADDLDGLSKAERAKSSVQYRGFVVIARHGDEIVSFTGSDQRLGEFGNPEVESSPLGSLPAF